MNKTEFENNELRKIITEMFETDRSITKFRVLQIAGLENWIVLNVLYVIQKTLLWLLNIERKTKKKIFYTVEIAVGMSF